MKPLEILSAMPNWAKASPDQIVDSPAFAMPCRLGEETTTLRAGDVQAADTIDLALKFGDEPHTLRIARSPRFPDLDKIWDSRADVPGPILLALVEKECGSLLQLLENAVRRQVRLVGLADASASPDSQTMFLQVADIGFALTRSKTVVAALGLLRNLDLSSSELRAETLPAYAEYAAFALPATDLASLAVGDALLLSEIGTIPPRYIVDGRFVMDGSGVSPFKPDGRCSVFAAEPRAVTLGELFDATGESAKFEVPVAVFGMQLRLVQGGKLIAQGCLDKFGGQSAFVVESLTTNH